MNTLCSGTATPLAQLAARVKDKCPNQDIAGVMTMGSWDASHAADENLDFIWPKDTLGHLAELLGVADICLDSCVGVTPDFVEAIKEDSNSMRVGTTICGARPRTQ